MKRIFIVLLAGFLAAVLFISGFAFAGSVLHVNTEPGVTIWLDNELIGKTTDDKKSVVLKDLEPGSHSLRAARLGFDAIEKELTITEDHQAFEWRINFAKPLMAIN
jgi:hypothetical protein